MKNSILLIFAAILCFACKEDRVPLKEQWENEIRDTENAFSDLAQKEGIAKAFLTYADEKAVLMRNNNLIIGKEAIKEDFTKKGNSLKNLSLNWTPDFIEVSNSGDLGYTYGEYEITRTDSLGNQQSESGIFHTVWKRQEDGSWKFVFD